MEDRCDIDDVVRVLESKLAEVRAGGTIESEWKSFQDSVKLSRSFTVDERTQCSRDVVQELTGLNLNAPGSAYVTHGTKLHDQRVTNLCVYFSIISAIRHEIRKIVGSGKSAEINVDSNGDMYERIICIPKDKTISEVLEAKYFEYIYDGENKVQQNGASFERMMAVLLGCVSPRGLSARGGKSCL